MSTELQTSSIQFAPVVQPQSTQAMAAVAREAQEMQAAVFMARQFPRNPGNCLAAIEADCQRITLAEKAMYQYARGGSNVEGPTIRLLEVIVQRWGNIDTGWKVIDSSRHDVTVCQAWCWDLETNMKKKIEFNVPHIRDTKKGTITLTDQRDIYELTANMASRRQRNCMEAVIPGDVIEAAKNKCRNTMATKVDIIKARDEITQGLGKHGVQVAAIEKRIQKKISAMSGLQYVQLKNILNSLNDGMSVPSDWFEDILNPEKIAKEQKEASKPAEPLAQDKAVVNADTDSALMDFDTVCQEYASKKIDVESVLKQVGSSKDAISKLPAGRIRAATKYLTEQLKK